MKKNVKLKFDLSFNCLFDDKTLSKVIFNNNICCLIIDRQYINKIEFDFIKGNYSVYFLINKKNEIYIGQSENGINRVNQHKNKNIKEFEKCLIFTDDRNEFDKTTIDYLEFHYINHFLNHKKWKIINKFFKEKEPNINFFQEKKLNEIIKQINNIFLFVDDEFILNKDKKDVLVSFEEDKVYESDNFNEMFKSSTTKKPNNYTQANLVKELEKRNIARPSTYTSSVEVNNDIFYYKNVKLKKDINGFVMLKGSKIHNYNFYINKRDNFEKNSYEYKKWNGFLIRFNNQSISKESLEKSNDDNFSILKNDICIKSPSFAGCLANGKYASSGWYCFKNEKGIKLDIFRNGDSYKRKE